MKESRLIAATQTGMQPPDFPDDGRRSGVSVIPELARNGAGDYGYRQRCPQGAAPSKRDAQGRPHDIVAGTAPFFPHV